MVRAGHVCSNSCKQVEVFSTRSILARTSITPVVSALEATDHEPQIILVSRRISLRLGRIAKQTFASQGSFAKYGRRSKRELFLEQMNEVVPWSELLALVEPVYPKAGNGRQPVGLAIMLRTYFLQQWFGLSDPGMEEAFYDSAVLRRFAGWIWAWPRRRMKPRSCASATCLKQHDLCGEMLDTVNRYLETKGIRISTGTIVDATIIHAPSSTKNSSGRRDPEMHETKKGNQWNSGAKAHIGVDSKETVVHSVMHLGGQRGRQAYVARLTARRRDARCGAMAAIKARRRPFAQPRRGRRT